MDCVFKSSDLELLETDPGFSGGFSAAVVKSFRKRMQEIRAAPDERVFYQLRSLRFEKLKGKRSHQHSMRLNDQFRLVIEIEEGPGGKRLLIINIEDYH
jgi:proteic killer suppression protein